MKPGAAPKIGQLRSTRLYTNFNCCTLLLIPCDSSSYQTQLQLPDLATRPSCQTQLPDPATRPGYQTQLQLPEPAFRPKCNTWLPDSATNLFCQFDMIHLLQEINGLILNLAVVLCCYSKLLVPAARPGYQTQLPDPTVHRQLFCPCYSWLIGNLDFNCNIPQILTLHSKIACQTSYHATPPPPPPPHGTVSEKLHGIELQNLNGFFWTTFSLFSP